MTSGPGWYPDPGGQPGQFRYWDGRTWSAATTPNPQAPPPVQGIVGSGGPPLSGPQAPHGGQRPMEGQPSHPYGITPKKKSPIGWILGLVALLVVIAVVAVLAVRSLGGEGPVNDPPGPGNPSAVVCPDADEQTAAPPEQTGDRVASGKLSYPRLPQPFSAPDWDSRVPFGRDVQSQNATVESAKKGSPGWVAGVLIARLLAGDGFYGPKQGAAVVAQCITGKFYGDSEVKREDSVNKAMKIDGYDAWIIESHLSFDVPQINTKGEKMIIVVVNVGDGEGGLFYASIPDTSPQFEQPARDALKDLKVDK